MMNHHVRSRTAAKAAVLSFALGTALGVQGSVVNLTSSSDITGFQSGATVQTFDSISGITAVPITSYNALDISGTSALFTKDATQTPYFNSGGATFSNPASNPGTPIGIVTPTGGISGDKLSGDNVAGPLGVVTPPFTLFDSGAFMEVIFPTPVSKVGFFAAHGDVKMFLKDTSNNNLATGDAEGTAAQGQFLGITRGSADIGGVSLFSAVIGQTFTIDDFTFGTTGGSNGGGGGGGGGNTVPDTGNALNLALAGAFLVLASRNLTPRKA